MSPSPARRLAAAAKVSTWVLVAAVAGLVIVAFAAFVAASV